MAINPGSFQPPLFGALNLVALGTTQATATQLIAGGNVFARVDPGGCAVLPAPDQNQVLVWNDGASALKVLPNFGDRIGQLAVNAFVLVQPGGSAVFNSFDTPLTASPRAWYQGATNTAAGVNVVADNTTTVGAVTRLQFSAGSVTDGGGGVANINVTAASGTIVAQGGPFLAGGTVVTNGTIHNSTSSLTPFALLLGNGAGAVVPAAGVGVITQVLHGNGSGAPFFGSVDLTTDVTGHLPFANMASMAPGLLGNSGTISAVPSVIEIGDNLTLANGTISATTGGGGVTLAAHSILGNDGTAAAVGTSIAIGANLTLNSGTLSASASGGVMLQAQASLSPANILALNTTPITLVPAPGVGFMVKPITGSIVYRHVSAPYTGGGNTNLFYGSSAGSTSGTSFAGAFQVASNRVLLEVVATSGTFATAQVDNLALVLQSPTAFAGGDGTALLTVDYVVLPSS